MSIQELGSLGELIGAIAVLATLIYLSLQTRQARIAAEETAKFSGLQATHSMLDLYFDWRRTLFSDPAHRDIIAKANEGKDLLRSEQFTVGLLFHDLFFAAAYSSISAASGGSMHEEEADVEYIVWILRENPCALVEWNRVKGIVARMDRNFVSQVDQQMEAK